VEGEHNPTFEMRKPFEILKRQHNVMPLELRSDMLEQYVEFMREDHPELRNK